jgi:hypothetical protein
LSLAVLGVAVRVGAQTPTASAPAEQDHQHHQMSSSRWMWMYDGALFLTVNSQGGERSENQVRSQNWLMATAMRRVGTGQLSFNGMLSAEPLTATKAGYAELFQMGEAYQGLENIDRQHPHELFAQLSTVWQVPIRSRVGVTVAGAPVGEPTVGPSAFMHRASAAENPTAPLSHHTTDSTHVAQGVIGVGATVGSWTAEGSAFHGREPNEDRYDIDVGPLDSWAARIWYRPSDSWEAQISYGFLKSPEELEPGDIRRTTGSISWTHDRPNRLYAVTAVLGHNKRTYTDQTAFLLEGTARRNRNSLYVRIELLQVETEHLLFPTVVHKPHPGEFIDPLGAFTAGAVRDLLASGPVALGVGGDITYYGVPERLIPSYGKRPVSFHVFLRVRPRTAHASRMWNMTMMRPMPMTAPVVPSGGGE